MPCRVTEVHRITRHIGIAVPPAFTERAPTVRAVEAHQCRAEGPVAGTQQIIPRPLITTLAIEAQHPGWLGSIEPVRRIAGLCTSVLSLPFHIAFRHTTRNFCHIPPT